MFIYCDAIILLHFFFMLIFKDDCAVIAKARSTRLAVSKSVGRKSCKKAMHVSCNVPCYNIHIKKYVPRSVYNTKYHMYTCVLCVYVCVCVCVCVCW